LLKFINLEDNGIESWDEVVGFRTLPNLKRLTLNKNKIKSIYAKDGFRSLDTLAINDNLIDSWTSFDELNNFPCIKSLKASGNPITTVEAKPEVQEETKDGKKKEKF
jgi:Leucine-rich repeat (LRR) protein